MTGKSRRSKGNDTDVDIEKLLLEAKRRRLLGQQESAGAVHSRPVDLDFMSVKEKSRIGKRRRLSEVRKLVVRHGVPTKFPPQSGWYDLEDHGDVYMSGALPILTGTDNIRVRIGSDALTTAASTQPNNDTQSQTNSDSMLFDKEDEDAGWQTDLQIPQSAMCSGHALAADTGLIDIQPSESHKGRSPPHGQYTQRGLTARLDTNAGVRIWHDPPATMSRGHSAAESDATGPIRLTTYHVEDVERSLELNPDRRSSPKAALVASPIHQPGELQHVHADLTAEEGKPGSTSRTIGGARQSSVRRPPNALVIVDDEPWRTYLDIGLSSFGHPCADDGTGMSAPQPHVPARNTRADRTSWPQHGTWGKLTHVNLSTVPASLPAPKQPSGRLPDARPLLRTEVTKEVSEHEKTWRSFVLGSEPESATDTIHAYNETSEDSMSQATKGYASTRLLLSNAVTSASSTPFRSLSGQASRISDDVQHMPHSESRSIRPAASSYAVWGRLEPAAEDDIQNESQGEEIPARSRFGAQSSRASIQNHAPHDSDIFSDTRTSYDDLDRRDGEWDDVSRQAQASGSIVWQRDRDSFIWDIPDSDEAGIDLVDAQRST